MAEEAWQPHDPTKHPKYRFIEFTAARPIEFERIGRVTICTALIKSRERGTVAARGVSIRSQEDADDPRIGKREALWNALERYANRRRNRN